MRVLLFAPNGGASLSIGGGTNFTLKQASILTEQGHEVAVAGFHALPLDILTAMARVRIGSPVRLFSHGGDAAYGLARALPIKVSAYNVLLTPGFGSWVQSVLTTFRPDLVWFHDDIPAAAEPFLRRCRTMLYVHYPLMARRQEITPPLDQGRSWVESLNDVGLQFLRPVLTNAAEVCDEVWVNSSITARVVTRLWDTVNPKVIPTYVDLPAASEPKHRCVIAIGSFSQGKNYSTLVEGFAAATTGEERDRWQLHIFGHIRDRAYFASLHRKIEACGADDRIFLHVDATGPELEAALRAASVIVQPAVFEPFGISLVEGMAHGAEPITFQGEWAGGWTDITEQGRWGRGFRTVEELAARLGEAFRQGDPTASARAMTRAAFYDRGRLSESLRAAV